MAEQTSLEKHLVENQFITQSYTLYGGSSGYQDYGIMGCIVRNKILDIWRQQFVRDNIYEVETPILTPHAVLKASGHVDNFTDYVIIDRKNNKEYRADHIIKKHLKECDINSSLVVDRMTPDELEKYAKDNLEKVLDIPKDEIKIVPKNLMFQAENMYMRPEIAQGMFVNFKRYYDFLKHLPFGIAQIGKSYRKEISPKPFTRMREFTQAEIEYFFDPLDTSHKDFEIYSQSDIKLPILSAESQLNDNKIMHMTLAQLVESKIVCNQIMVAFLYKIYLFAETIGIHIDQIRFRQHMKSEMAHYAGDCWDLECLVDNNWLECVGCAYRQDYDIKSHSLKSGQSMTIKRNDKVAVIKPKISVIGKTFKNNAKQIIDHINCHNKQCQNNVTINGFVILINEIAYNITTDMYDIVEVYDEYYPHVIEPSFGIDRLLYAVLSQNYWKRDNDDQRVVLSLNNFITPFDFAILQLSNNSKLLDYVSMMKNALAKLGIRCYTDMSGTSIGKRYCRTDKLGIKYVITIDFDTLKNDTVTIRDRDSMRQIRIATAELESVNSMTHIRNKFDSDAN